MVQQFEREQGRDLAVLIDLWQPKRPESADLERVELAVSFAATICDQQCREGASRLWLGLAGAQSEVHFGPASQSLLRELMHQLAIVTAHSGDSVAHMLNGAAERIPPSTDVIFISTRGEPEKRTDHLGGQLHSGDGSRVLEGATCLNVIAGELDPFFTAI